MTCMNIWGREMKAIEKNNPMEMLEIKNSFAGCQAHHGLSKCSLPVPPFSSRAL